MYMELRKASGLGMDLLWLMLSKVILMYSLHLTAERQEDQVWADFWEAV